MKTPPSVFLALLLATLPAQLRAADAASASPQAIDPKDIEAALVPEKKAILPGEPIFVTFTVRNKGKRELGVYEGCPAYFEAPWSPANYFKLTIMDEQGRALPLLPGKGPPGTIGELRNVSKLAAGSDYTMPLFLPSRVVLDKPGNYTVTVSKVVGFSLPGPRKLSPSEDYTKDLLTLNMTATTTIKVLPPDSEKMGHIIDEIGAKTVALGKKNTEDGVEEDRIEKDWFHGGVKADDTYSWIEKLLAIHDERTIPWLLRTVLTTRNDEAREQVLCGLAWSRSDAAFAALKTAMATPREKIVFAPVGPGSTPASSAAEFRELVLDAIVASKHAGAAEFTLKYRHDPDSGVRGVVVHLAWDMKPEESVPFLLEFTKDSDSGVSLAAKEDLCRACRKIAPQEAIPILHDLAATSNSQLASDVKAALDEAQKKLEAQPSIPR